MAHSRSLPLKRPSKFNFAVDVVDYWASQDPNQLALHWIDQNLSNERKFTYAHFSHQSHRIANLFSSLDIKPGDIAIIILPRIPEWWEIACACLRSGVVLCPATTLLVAKDIEYRIQASHANVFIGDDVAVNKVLKVKSACPTLKRIIQVRGKATEGATDFHQILSKIPQDAHHDVPSSLTVKSPAVIYFTSGTTGPPKIAQHNQISYPLASTLTGVHWLQLSPGKLFWAITEQGWAKAAWAFFSTFNTGAALFVFDDRGAFNPFRLLDILHRFPITTMCAPPTAYRQLVLTESQKYFKSHPPHSLSHCCGAGEPLNESVIRTWSAMTSGIQIYDGYGQTEMILVCANQASNPVKPGSMGKPVPEVPLVVLDENLRETKTDAEGDIALILSANPDFFGFFDGYLSQSPTKIPTLDQRILTSKSGQKIFLTGDRATRDSEGYFWFVGRADDVINSSGYRIGPFEVESTLKQHPAVIESAVVASPDPARDEVVKAFIVLTDDALDRLTPDPGKGSGDINDSDAARKLAKELQDFCKENAAPYKYPRKVEFVSAGFIAGYKTISGKIRRGELKKLERERDRKVKGGKL